MVTEIAHTPHINIQSLPGGWKYLKLEGLSFDFLNAISKKIAFYWVQRFTLKFTKQGGNENIVILNILSVP